MINRKLVIAACLGNALEWYDFGLFGFFAVTLSEMFFPFQGKVGALISTFLVFAIGLLMRPFGGMIFGYIGDKFGRKMALVLSIALISIPTFMLGLLPTYAQIGIAAPILLILIRLIQGVAVGGELIGSTIFLIEHAPKNRRGLMGALNNSFAAFGTLSGSCVGLLSTYLVKGDDFLRWGWRLPFLFGIVVGLLGIYLRSKVSETPLFLELEKKGLTAKEPIREAIRENFHEIITVFLLICFQATIFYLPFVYLISWLGTELHISKSSSLLISAWGLILSIIFTPLFAMLSDKIGRKKILISASIAMLTLAYPLFLLLTKSVNFAHPYVPIFIAFTCFGLMNALFVGPLGATITELLTTKNRYMSLVLGYNTSAGIFGGFTPLLSTLLVDWTLIPESPSILLIFASIVATLTIKFRLKETYQITLK